MGSMGEGSQQHPQNVISKTMPINAIIKRLVNHGCPNISSRLNIALCDQNPYSPGGLGDVHQGMLLDGTRVALKCLRFYLKNGEKYHRGFKHAARELHTWSKCRHPNVVEFLGLAEFRGQIAMVSPWMGGGSMDCLDSSNDQIDRCRLCFGIARGLAYLHEIDIVHGDLKAGNVLLSNDGEAQLTDFGSAALASSTLLFTESNSARSGFSVRWAAPEQLEGEVTCSREADIYSLGMTILEIISRQQPYAYIQNEAAVIVAILVKRQRPKRPEDMIPADSSRGEALWSLLESCWSWNPKDRPVALSVVKEIETIKSEDLLVKPPETSTKSSSPRLASDLNELGTKRRLETIEGDRDLQKKRPRLEADKSMQIPITHQHLISKATGMLGYVASRKGQLVNGRPPTNPCPMTTLQAAYCIIM